MPVASCCGLPAAVECLTYVPEQHSQNCDLCRHGQDRASACSELCATCLLGNSTTVLEGKVEMLLTETLYQGGPGRVFWI